MAKKQGKKKTTRMGLAVDIDLTEAVPEAGDPPGLLRNFVYAGGIAKWGNATFKTAGNVSATYDKLSDLKKVDVLEPNEPGHHTAVIVFLERGADQKWRFHQVVTEEVQVLA